MSRKVVAWVWFLVMIVVCILMVHTAIQPTIYEGSSLIFTLTVNDKLLLGSDATIEAVSAKYFLLDDHAKHFLASERSITPLGWDSEEYWVLPETDIQAGEWDVQEGSSVTVRLTKESSLAATIYAGNRVVSGIFAVVLAIIVWFVVWLVIPDSE